MSSASSRAFSTGSSSQNGFRGSAAAHSSVVFSSAHIYSDSDLSNLVGGNSSPRLARSCEGGDQGEPDWPAGLPVMLFCFFSQLQRSSASDSRFYTLFMFLTRNFWFYFIKSRQRQFWSCFSPMQRRILLPESYLLSVARPCLRYMARECTASCVVLALTTRWHLATLKQRPYSREQKGKLREKKSI